MAAFMRTPTNKENLAFFVLDRLEILVVPGKVETFVKQSGAAYFEKKAKA